MKKAILFATFFFAFAFATQAQTAKTICGATTKAGQPCKIKIDASKAVKFCQHHDATRPTCGATTKAGQPCKVKTNGGKCWRHDPSHTKQD